MIIPKTVQQQNNSKLNLTKIEKTPIFFFKKIKIHNPNLYISQNHVIIPFLCKWKIPMTKILI